MGAAQRSYDEIIDMFARGGGAGTVLAFRPSAEAQARVRDLLARSNAGTLTEALPIARARSPAFDFA